MKQRRRTLDAKAAMAATVQVIHHINPAAERGNQAQYERRQHGRRSEADRRLDLAKRTVRRQLGAQLVDFPPARLELLRQAQVGLLEFGRDGAAARDRAGRPSSAC